MNKKFWKSDASISMGVIYATIGIIFLLITLLNVYAYFSIASMSSDYAEMGSFSKSFRIEYQGSLQALQDIVLNESREKTFEKDVWAKLDRAREFAKSLIKLQKELAPLEKNLDEYKKASNEANKFSDPNQKEERVKRCAKLYADAETSVNNFESSLKEIIDNRMAFVRFVYIVLILTNIAAFAGIFSVIFYNERRYKHRAKLMDGKNSNLSALLQGFDSIIFIIDNKGIVRSWNINAERYFDKPEGEALNRELYELFPFFAQFKSLFDTALYSNKRMFKYHEWLSINRGPMRALNVLCVPMSSADFKKGYSELLVKLDDVTSFRIEDERYILDQKIHAMYAMLESVERDSAQLMEDIGGSMDRINGIAQQHGAEAEVVPYTGYMRNMLAQIGIIPQLYMSAVAGTSFSKTQIDLNEMLMYVLRLCQKTFDSRVSIEVSLNESRSWVLANPVRLFYAFLNIVNNAEDAMISMRGEGGEAGGILSVSVEKIPGERVAIDKIVRYRQAFEDEPAFWIILISDTGVGMTPEIKGRVFDPFFTTKNKLEHKGLGLCTVANIVNELDGHLDISTKVGRGTVFKLFLPESKDASKGESAADDSLHSDDSEIVRGSGAILLVIDDTLLCGVMTKLFNSLGYEAIPAGNGFKAVNIYAERAAEIKGVILDISTKYMTSADTFFQLRAVNPDVKVIVAQNSDREEAIGILKANGFNNFIQKPYPIDLISRKIAEFETNA